MASKIWKCAFQIGYNIYCTSLGSFYFNRQLKDGRAKFPKGHSVCRPIDVEDTLRIIPIPYAYDNYAYIVHRKGDSHCAVIDPGAAAEVIATLKEHQLDLVVILITHKHWDHSGGVSTLIHDYKNVQVVGWKTERPETLTLPQTDDRNLIGVFRMRGENGTCQIRVSAMDQRALYQEDGSVEMLYQVPLPNSNHRKESLSQSELSKEGKCSCHSSCLPCGTVSVTNQTTWQTSQILTKVNVEDILFGFRLLHTPGHTHGHCVYQLLIPNSTGISNSAPVIFTGDLIFLGGMGRVLEGTLEEQMRSISRILAEFPNNTHIFPGHEYALSNLIFVEKEMECDDPPLRDKLSWCIKRRKKKLPTFPSTLEEELSYNPFLKLANSIAGEHRTTSTNTCH